MLAAMLLQFQVCNLQFAICDPIPDTPAATANEIAVVKNALALVPSDALGFGLVKNLTEADAKVQKLAGLVGAPAISVLDKFKTESAMDKAVDEKGALVVILVRDSGDAPPLVVAGLPVTDFKQFLGQFEGAKADGEISDIKTAIGAKFFVARRGGYALLAKRDGRKALEHVLNAKQSIAAEVAGIEPWLAANDASFVGTRAGIALAADQGRQQLEKLDKDFGKIGKDFGTGGDANLLSGDPLASMRMVLRFYGKVLDAAEKEVALAAVGVSADDQGTICVKGRLRLVRDSRIGQSLGQIQPQRQDLLAGLPGGPFLLAFGAAMPKPLMRQLADVGLEFMKMNASMYGLSPEQAVQLGKLSTQGIEHAHTLSVVMKPGKRGEPIYSNIFACLRVDSAPRYLDQYQTQIQAVNQVLKQAAGGLMKPTEVKRLEIGGHPALELQVTIPLPKIAEGNPAQVAQQAMMRLMFGSTNKVTVYVAAANETTAVLGYGTTPERVRELIELIGSGKAGLAGDTDLAATAAGLPAGAQWVAYVSPRGYMGLVQRMFREMAAGMGGGPGMALPAPFSLPPFPQTPPVGVAVQASAGTLDSTLVVPSAVLKAAGQYILSLQQAVINPNPQIP
jgi:hypothetical protein